VLRVSHDFGHALPLLAVQRDADDYERDALRPPFPASSRGVPGTLDRILAANRRYADGSPPAGLPRPPARNLIVITCMDARIDPFRALGLRIGDAHVLRNAGAVVSDEVLRSIEVSRGMGTSAALLIGHTDCAGYLTEEEAADAVRAGLQRLRSALPEEFEVHGLVFDVETARLRAMD
jgi:carbonic anhydrase